MFDPKDNPLWCEKYRPKTVADTILPERLKKVFQKYVDDGNPQNMTLAGPPGIGKTTVARAMLDELGCDYIVVNGSLNGNIDTLRTQITSFATSVSFTGLRKYVILDEADYMNAQSTQPALRNFIEEYSSNCGFILTCNFPAKILDALKSRCPVIDLKVMKSEMPSIASQFFKRCEDILTAEKVEYDKPALAEIIKKFLPDWRQTLNQLQRYAQTGKIDAGALVNLQTISMKELVTMMKDKNFSGIRKWVAENIDSDETSIYRAFYDSASNYLSVQDQAQLILLLAKYQYQAAFVADHEINLTAFLVECMIELEFKL